MKFFLGKIALNDVTLDSNWTIVETHFHIDVWPSSWNLTYKLQIYPNLSFSAP